MQTVLTWLGAALAAVFAVAVCVAAWEHYRQLAGRVQDWPQPPPSDHLPLTTSVDLDVDTFAKLPPPQGDSADRSAALARTLGKLSQAPADAAVSPAPLRSPRTPVKPPAARPQSWADTEPTAGPGARVEATSAPAKADNA